MLNLEWKEIPGFEGIYWASTCGKIRNSRLVRKHFVNNSGYACIDLVDANGKKTKWLVHRLIAMTWLQTMEHKTYVNHIDGNKLNNALHNLEWVTCSENILHARATGLNPYNLPTLGIKKGRSSSFCNVSYDKARDKWVGCVRHNSKTLGIKRFDSEEAAARHADQLIDLYGLEGRTRNFPK